MNQRTRLIVPGYLSSTNPQTGLPLLRQRHRWGKRQATNRIYVLNPRKSTKCWAHLTLRVKASSF